MIGIRKVDYTLDDNAMETLRYNCEIFIQQNKKRKIYTYDKLSVEKVLHHL